MDLDTFWNLIERSGQEAADPDTRVGWLTAELAGRPRSDIVDFQAHLDAVRQRADGWDLWGAAYQVCDGLCSDDSFWYFQSWLVGLGPATFARVVADPDALADVPQIRRLAGRPIDDWADDEWPEWEALDCAAEDAYEEAGGQPDGLDAALAAAGHVVRSAPQPPGPGWSFDDPHEVIDRLPRIGRMFPLSPRADREARSRAVLAQVLHDRGQTEDEFFADVTGDVARQ